MFNFQFESTSFFIGLAVGLIAGILTAHLRNIFPQLLSFFRTRVSAIRAKLMAGVEQYLRQVTLKMAQRNHLASKLFSLDEVIIPPRFLPHLSFGDPANLTYETNVTSQAISFLPGWAELASQYPYPDFSLTELMSNKANIFILGQPGAGKSIALAHFASMIARKDPAAGSFVDAIPVYLHIQEIELPAKINDPFDLFIKAASQHLPKVIQSRLPRFLSANIREGKIIILLDGLDELHFDQFSAACELLKNLLEKYPLVRLVTTAPLFAWDQLVACGLTPVSIAHWNYAERAAFIAQWSKAWQDKISPLIRKKKPALAEEIDHRLSSSWLPPESVHLTPLEWTLKLWAFHSNDTPGTSGLHLLESYIKRTTAEYLPEIALANLAAGFVTSKNGTLSLQEVEAIISRFTYSSEPAHAAAGEAKQPSRKGKTEKKGPAIHRSIPGLVSQGFFKEIRPGHFSIQHPVIAAFLASLALADTLPSEIKLNTRLSLYDDQLFHYLVAQGFDLNLVEQMQKLDAPPFHESLIFLLSWLKDAPHNAQWRTEVLKQAVQSLHDTSTPDITRHTLAGLLAGSNDPGLPVLFRQLLSSPLEVVRRVIALASGAIQDFKAIPDLSRLLDDPSIDVRISTILAIGILRNQTSLKASLAILSEGEEILRQAAAETLAHFGDEGQQALKDALTSQNLLLRRAVVYGLSEIKQDWARKLLEKIAVEDGQWVVRNASSHALENFQQPSPFLPAPLPVPSESSWLIAFASRQGIGVVPGKPVDDLLLKALEIGTPEERLASLTYLRQLKGDNIFHSTYVVANGDAGIVREYAYLILWYLAVSAKVVSI